MFLLLEMRWEFAPDGATALAQKPISVRVTHYPPELLSFQIRYLEGKEF